MLYGNASMGFSYSPDRRNDRVNHNNSRSAFIGANGNRQGGYYSSNSSIANIYYGNSKTNGYYDGAGRYHEN